MSHLRLIKGGLEELQLDNQTQNPPIKVTVDVGVLRVECPCGEEFCADLHKVLSSPGDVLCPSGCGYGVHVKQG